MLKSTRFRWVVAIVGLTLIAIFAFVTRDAPSGVPLRANVGVGPVPGTHYVVRDGGFSEQQLVCADDPVPVKALKFDQPKVIKTVTICNDYPSRHDFTLERSALTAAVLDQLSAALALPDEPRDDTVMCTMEYPMLSSIVIELKSGDVVRPTVPISTCRKPLAEASAAIAAVENFQSPQD